MSSRSRQNTINRINTNANNNNNNNEEERGGAIKRTRLDNANYTSTHTFSSSSSSSTAVAAAAASSSSSYDNFIGKTSKKYDLVNHGKDLIFPSHKPIPDRPNDAVRQGPQKQPIKKLVIKGLKDKPKLPDNYEEVTWSKLQAAVQAIFNYQRIGTSLEELYKACENLCLHKMAPSLYKRLAGEIEEHLKVEKTKLENNLNENDTLLIVVNKCWQAHCEQMGLIRSIFLYLDRTYVLQTSGVISIWDKGLEIFQKQIMSSSAGDIKKKTMNGLITLIRSERNGDSVDRSLLHSLIHMFIDLGIYCPSFENLFLMETRNYYHHEGISLVSEITVPRYLKHVKKRLREESDRVSNYLDWKTKNPLTKVVDDELIKRHVDTLLEKGFNDMMEDQHADEHIQELGRLYDLLARVNSLDRLRLYFGNYIKKTGSNIVNNVNQESTMVEDLLALKKKMDSIVAISFDRNYNFAHAVKESFEVFINQRQNKPAELIAKYVDLKLKLGNKRMDDLEIEKTLDEVLVLFRYIQGKDIFEAFYKRDLAKRLLLNKSASFDYERSMLSKLRKECGPGFTSKLEGMFKDIDLSRDFMNSFYHSRISENLRTNIKIDLYVNVLTQGFWPTYSPSPLILPPVMAECQEIFKEFYLSKHGGRNLKWQNSLGHCLLAAEFPKGNKELVVSLFQAVVLLQFNDLKLKERISYEHIKEHTGIEKKELDRTLQSLACGKVRVLKKHPKGRDVSPTDSFSVDEMFDVKFFRIKVNAIQMKETLEENQETNERVFLDRQYQVDAALVRIMKMRKKLSHNELVSELLSQLKFKAQVSDIKKRIESLIEREYLERDSEDSSILKYLA
ncbi:Cullin family-domain-containing protein [Rhizophagus diaphanus]|nr:Cullin family-domain-containing protein [Rhizophagus diaphanus] [Rhizophagus sp. MUCL 43196]